MRTFLLLFCTTVFSFSPSDIFSQNVKIVIDKDKVLTIDEVFDLLREQTEYTFIYQEDLFKNTPKMKLQKGTVKANKLLNEIFSKGNFDFEFTKGHQIIVTKSISSKAKPIKEDVQQQLKVTGTITDSNNMPLPGVSVIQKGTNNGALSDFDGNYAITIAKGEILEFSYLGKKDQIITIGDSNVINIIMEDDTSELDEVVIVGYGTRKKSTLTGAVSAVGGEKVLKNHSANLTTGLSGLIPGLVINQRSGRPGAEDISVLIRGQASFGNNPLLVIDGIPQGVGALGRLSQNDIESISVLKDASAAIYGVNAADGVILVKTKRGKKGEKPVYSFTSTFSALQPTVKPNWTNSYDTARMLNIESTYLGGNAVYSDEDLEKMRTGSSPLTHAGPNIDWFDEVYANWAPLQRHSFTVNGGSDRISYFFSGEILDQEGQYIDSDAVYYKRSQYRTNLDFQATDNLKLSVDLRGTFTDRSQEQAGDQVRLRALQAPAEALFRYPNGLPATFQDGNNPALLGSKITGYNKTYGTTFTGVFRYEYKMDFITKGLSFEGFAQYGTSLGKTSLWENTWFTYAYDEPTDEYLSIASTGNIALNKRYTDNKSSQVNTYIKYAKAFNDHSFDAFIGMESRKFENESLQGSRDNFATDIVEQIDAGDILTVTNSGFDNETAALSYFGILNYNYKNKYLIDFTFRADGSYKFPKNKRWGYFPGISAGWRISEEPFFKENLGNSVNFMKFRASWGKMGLDNTDPFQYLATYSIETFARTLTYLGENGTPVASYTLDGFPNPNITWEEQESIDVGVDMQFASGAVDLTVDYFKNKRTKILIPRNASVPSYYGIELPDENIGKVDSWGFDGNITYKNSVKKDLSYYVGGTFTFTKNEVVFIDEAAGLLDFQRAEGRPLSSSLLYETDGLFQNQEEIDNYPSLPGAQPGDIKYIDQLTVDTDGDGVYDEADGVIDGQDRVGVDKGSTPEIVYGLNFGVNYKNFDFTARLQGQARSWSSVRPQLLDGNARIDQEYFDGRWQQEGDNKYPIAYGGPTGNNVNLNFDSTFWLTNTSFLRVKALEIGYNFPKNLKDKLNIKDLRLFISGDNLFTFDNMPISRDPEVLTYTSTEISRVITLGVNLSF